jgi:hypothetical protein
MLNQIRARDNKACVSKKNMHLECKTKKIQHCSEVPSAKMYFSLDNKFLLSYHSKGGGGGISTNDKRFSQDQTNTYYSKQSKIITRMYIIPKNLWGNKKYSF